MIGRVLQYVRAGYHEPPARGRLYTARSANGHVEGKDS
jgi:hypothetical protein